GNRSPSQSAFTGSNIFAAELPCLPQAHPPAIILSEQAPTSSRRMTVGQIVAGVSMVADGIGAFQDYEACSTGGG
ncbi:MAG TPA: hypothetical protein VIJ38_17595, partial [Acidobacteriaceae bacterium]